MDIQKKWSSSSGLFRPNRLPWRQRGGHLLTEGEVRPSVSSRKDPEYSYLTIALKTKGAMQRFLDDLAEPLGIKGSREDQRDPRT